VVNFKYLVVTLDGLAEVLMREEVTLEDVYGKEMLFMVPYPRRFFVANGLNDLVIARIVRARARIRAEERQHLASQPFQDRLETRFLHWLGRRREEAASRELYEKIRSSLRLCESDGRVAYASEQVVRDMSLDKEMRPMLRVLDLQKLFEMHDVPLSERVRFDEMQQGQYCRPEHLRLLMIKLGWDVRVF
jgi:hypothetical protein